MDYLKKNLTKHLILQKKPMPVECGEGEELLMDNVKLEIWERTSTYLQFDNTAKPF